MFPVRNFTACHAIINDFLSLAQRTVQWPAKSFRKVELSIKLGSQFSNRWHPSSAAHCENVFCNLALKTKRKINGKDHNWFSTRLLIADEFAFLQFIDCITARLNALHMHMVHENGGAIGFEHLVQVQPSLRSRTQNDNTVRLKSERITDWH